MPSTGPRETPLSRSLQRPVLWGSIAAVAIAVVGAIVGFDILGSIGPVPTLLVVAVVVFAVGAGLTVRRIAALRSDDASSAGPHADR